MVNYYCLITSDFEEKSAIEILTKRLDKKKYPLYKMTPFLKEIKKDDKVIFYLAGKKNKAQNFIGNAVVESIEISTELDIDTEKNKQVYKILLLKNIKIFETSISIRSIVHKLEFIVNKYNFGLNLIGGAVKITENDFYLIKN